jgi:hypothetical protein
LTKEKLRCQKEEKVEETGFMTKGTNPVEREKEGRS